MGDDIRISYGNYDLDESEEPTLVILDTGIAVEQTPLNLQKLRLLFRAVVDKRVSKSNIYVNIFDIVRTHRSIINVGPSDFLSSDLLVLLTLRMIIPLW